MKDRIRAESGAIIQLAERQVKKGRFGRALDMLNIVRGREDAVARLRDRILVRMGRTEDAVRTWYCSPERNPVVEKADAATGRSPARGVIVLTASSALTSFGGAMLVAVSAGIGFRSSSFLEARKTGRLPAPVLAAAVSAAPETASVALPAPAEELIRGLRTDLSNRWESLTVPLESLQAGIGDLRQSQVALERGQTAAAGGVEALAGQVAGLQVRLSGIVAEGEKGRERTQRLLQSVLLAVKPRDRELLATRMDGLEEAIGMLEREESDLRNPLTLEESVRRSRVQRRLQDLRAELAGLQGEWRDRVEPWLTARGALESEGLVRQDGR